MLVMAEENKKANILVVSLTQTSRVIFVVILVPLISYFLDNHHEMNHTTMEVPTLSQTLNIWQIIILFSMVGIIYIGMSKLTSPLNNY